MPWPKGKPFAPETIEKMRGRIPWNKGLTKETDARIAAYVSMMPITQRGRVPWNKGLKRSNAHVPRTLGWKSKISEGLKLAYKEKRATSYFKKHGHDPELILARAKGANRKPTLPEKLLDNILNVNFVGEWEYVGDGKVIIETLNPDFINCNGRKEIIEVFGDYWHGPENNRPFTSEADRREIYARYGFRLLVIWEHELKGSEQEIVKKIKLWEVSKC